MPPDTNHRSQDRSNVFLSAALVAGSTPVPVRVRNLSSRGALLDGGSLPPAGSTVRLVRGALTAEARIAWQADGQAGIRFAREIDVIAWTKRVGHPGQRQVDDALAALRGGSPVPAAAAHPDAPSLKRISAELDTICERLAGSPAMTVELGEELVKLDSLARELQQLTGARR